jgi:uncharacterized protein
MKQLILIMVLGICIVCSPDGNASSSPLISKLEKLAVEENAEAIYHLGMAYHTGSQVDRDYEKALSYFEESARLGDPLGAYKLGCYYDGQGEGQVDRNVEKALKYKLIAAKAGYAQAQQDVARIYADKGMTAQVLFWLEKAAAQGWSDGLMSYASVHNGSPGFESDPVKTAAYFRLFMKRTEPSKRQKDWLSDFEQKMTTAQMKQVMQIVSDYQAVPTVLTIKALSGQTAAEELVNTAN